MKNSFKFLTAATLAVLIVLPAVAVAESSHSSVNKSIRVDENSTTGNVDSVNGSIRIGANSFAKSVESVNGSVELGNDVTVDRNNWPITIDANPSNPNGWEYHMCVLCEVYDYPTYMGYWEFSVDNIMFKQLKDCSTTIQPGIATDKSYPYTAGGSPEEAYPSATSPN